MTKLHAAATKTLLMHLAAASAAAKAAEALDAAADVDRKAGRTLGAANTAAAARLAIDAASLIALAAHATATAGERLRQTDDDPDKIATAASYIERAAATAKEAKRIAADVGTMAPYPYPGRPTDIKADTAAKAAAKAATSAEKAAAALHAKAAAALASYQATRQEEIA